MDRVACGVDVCATLVSYRPPEPLLTGDEFTPSPPLASLCTRHHMMCSATLVAQLINISPLTGAALRSVASTTLSFVRLDDRFFTTPARPTVGSTEWFMALSNWIITSNSYVDDACRRAKIDLIAARSGWRLCVDEVLHRVVRRIQVVRGATT